MVATQRDYYEILGVSRSASDKEIRKAYKKLARQYHPDVKPGDANAAQKFKEVQAAYDVLKIKDKREQYDLYGHDFEHIRRGPSGGNGETYAWSSGGPVEFDLNDLFGGLGGNFRNSSPDGGFNGSWNRPRIKKGSDLRTSIDIPFKLAAEGGSFDFSVSRNNAKQTLSVKIPPGIDSGTVIRLSGEGDPSISDGPNGDLLVRIRVLSHAYLRRVGADVHIDVPITPSEAVLGTKVEIPTLSDGLLVLTIPPSTSSGSKLRLRGKGIRNGKTGELGNQIVTVTIKVPSSPSTREQELYEELARESPDNPRAKLW